VLPIGTKIYDWMTLNYPYSISSNFRTISRDFTDFGCKLNEDKPVLSATGF